MKTWLERCKDPRWQKKRLKVLNRDEFRCQLCWDDKTTLNVHHKYYKKGKNPWEYPMKALITLCEKCHKKISKKQELIKRVNNNVIPTTSDEITTDSEPINLSDEEKKRIESRENFFKRFR